MNHGTLIFSPTCQVRVVRFYVRSTPAAPQLQVLDRSGPPGPEQAQDQSGPCRAYSSTASARSQWSPPDPNSKPRIRVVPAGNEQQALDHSGPCRTSTASARSQWSPPDANSKLKIRVVPTGPDKQFLG